MSALLVGGVVKVWIMATTEAPKCALYQPYYPTPCLQLPSTPLTGPYAGMRESAQSGPKVAAIGRVSFVEWPSVKVWIVVTTQALKCALYQSFL